jgi:hypothetical protein
VMGPRAFEPGIRSCSLMPSRSSCISIQAMQCQWLQIFGHAHILQCCGFKTHQKDSCSRNALVVRFDDAWSTTPAYAVLTYCQWAGHNEEVPVHSSQGPQQSGVLLLEASSAEQQQSGSSRHCI